MTAKTPSSKRSGKSKSTRKSKHNTDIEKHLSRIRAIHPELRNLVNGFLEERQIPLKLDAIHFAPKSAADYNCCVINGMVVCGPQCG